VCVHAETFAVFCLLITSLPVWNQQNRMVERNAGMEYIDLVYFNNLDTSCTYNEHNSTAKCQSALRSSCWLPSQVVHSILAMWVWGWCAYV